jgi:hypothetical protein
MFDGTGPMRAAKPGLGQGSPAGKTAQAAPDYQLAGGRRA